MRKYIKENIDLIIKSGALGLLYVIVGFTINEWQYWVLLFATIFITGIAKRQQDISDLIEQIETYRYVVDNDNNRVTSDGFVDTVVSLINNHSISNK